MYKTFDEIKDRKKIKIANQFNLIIINYKEEIEQKTKRDLIDVVNQNDPTYSPLALYFLLDNDLIKNDIEENKLFDELINETKLEKEIKNLIIYKKALFNSNFVSENDLLKILNPIINSESIWKSHALYLVGEYFYAKNELTSIKYN